MANTGFKGIDVVQTGSELIFRVPLFTSAGAIVTSGTTNLYLYELQDDGSLKSYDFNDNTFKTTALTTETQAMIIDAGLWTYSLSTLTGLALGSIYIIRIDNTFAYSSSMYKEFKYGNQFSLDIIPMFKPNYIGFVMRSSTDHRTVISGIPITAEISIDSAAFVSCTNAVQFFGDFYRISLTQSEMNGSVIALRFTATGADDNLLTCING